MIDIKEIATKTTFSESEIAEGIVYLCQKGISAEEAIKII